VRVAPVEAGDDNGREGSTAHGHQLPQRYRAPPLTGGEGELGRLRSGQTGCGHFCATGTSTPWGSLFRHTRALCEPKTHASVANGNGFPRSKRISDRDPLQPSRRTEAFKAKRQTARPHRILVFSGVFSGARRSERIIGQSLPDEEAPRTSPASAGRLRAFMLSLCV